MQLERVGFLGLVGVAVVGTLPAGVYWLAVTVAGVISARRGLLIGSRPISTLRTNVAGVPV